jgi:hypothetical protein
MQNTRFPWNCFYKWPGMSTLRVVDVSVGRYFQCAGCSGNLESGRFLNTANWNVFGSAFTVAQPKADDQPTNQEWNALNLVSEIRRLPEKRSMVSPRRWAAVRFVRNLIRFAIMYLFLDVALGHASFRCKKQARTDARSRGETYEWGVHGNVVLSSPECEPPRRPEDVPARAAVIPRSLRESAISRGVARSVPRLSSIAGRRSSLRTWRLPHCGNGGVSLLRPPQLPIKSALTLPSQRGFWGLDSGEGSFGARKDHSGHVLPRRPGTGLVSDSLVGGRRRMPSARRFGVKWYR